MFKLAIYVYLNIMMPVHTEQFKYKNCIIVEVYSG